MPEDILTCRCGWYGSIEDQDALGSECGCCPICGNENLVWLSDLQKLLDLQRIIQTLKKY